VKLHNDYLKELPSDLYERTPKEATFLFTNRADLESVPLARMHPVVIKSRDGMDLELAGIDPGPRWIAREVDRKQRVHDRALELAETTYLVAKTETDFGGRGAFAGVVPGEYWLSTGEGEATVGDVRLRWDIAVPVPAGRVTRVMLTNANAVRKSRD